MRKASHVCAAVGVVLMCGGAGLWAGEGAAVHGGAAAVDGQPAGVGCDRLAGAEDSNVGVSGGFPAPDRLFTCPGERERDAATSGPIWPAYTRVAPTGVTIVVPDDYPTIQAAIDAATPGDTVFVRAGTYFEHLVLDKQLVLQGEDAATTIIDGNAEGDILHVTASGADVQGFTFQNSGPGSYEAPDSGIVLTSVQDVHVAHCGFVNDNVGAWLCNVAYSVFEKSVFEGNGTGVLTDFDRTDPEYPGWFHANCILSNVFQSNGGAICFTHIMENDYNVVQGNMVADNGVGIFIIVADYNDFSYNTFLNNSDYAFYLDICFCGAFNNQIHHNNFVGNHGGGIQAYQAPAGVQGYFNSWYSLYDGVGNFWSDYAGVDADQDGLGDSPYLIPDGDDNDLFPLMHAFVPGDMNLDGALNTFDIDPFVLALTAPADYQAQYGQPGVLLGDCNFDGELNAFDIDSFVYRLTHADEIPIPPNRSRLAP